MTRTMRQTEACSSLVRIQHGRRRSEALFPSVDSVLDSLEPKLILKEEQIKTTSSSSSTLSIRHLV